MDTPRTLRIAAIQMCSRENRDVNLARARDLMAEAVRAGAEVIALPENFSFLGHEGEKLGFVEDVVSGPSIKLLQSFSAEHKVAIIGGSIPMATEDPSKVTNSCLVFDASGTLAARYDKLHLFDIKLDEDHTFEESRYIEAGRRIVTVRLFGHVMGLSICYDLRFPELYRQLTRKGAKVLFVPAAFTALTGKDHWEILLRARAIENQSYIVAPAQFGRHSDRRQSYGHTMIVDPWGKVLTQKQNGEGVILHDIDLGYVDLIRRQLPCLQHTRVELANNKI